MKFWFSGGEVVTPPPDSPTSAEKAYMVAGLEARFSDYVGTTRSPFDPANLVTWTGAVTSTGEADVSTSQSGVFFPSGVRLSSNAVLTNCKTPYVQCSAGTPTLNFCDLGDTTYGVDYPQGTGGVSPGNEPPFNGDSSIVSVSTDAVLTLNNCKVECGVDGFKANGNPGSALIIDYCWVNGYLMLSRDPFQDSFGGASTSHNDAIQVNSPGSGTAITVTRSRFDYHMALYAPEGSKTVRIGQPTTYDHSTGIYTEGTWYNTPAPKDSNELAGQQTYSPTAGADVSLQDYMLFSTGGVLLVSSGAVGAVDINNNWFRCYASSLVNVGGGTKLSTVSVTDNVIERFPNLDSVVSGHDYVRLSVSGGVDTWSGNVNEVGDPVASNAQ